MKFTAKHGQKADMDALDELIGMCEKSMIKPFSKKKAVEIEVTPEESEEDSTESDIDLSDLDKDDLLDLYLKMQDKG